MAKVIAKFSSKSTRVSFFQFFDINSNPYFKCDLTLPLCLGRNDDEIIADYKKLKFELGLNVELLDISFVDAGSKENK